MAMPMAAPTPGFIALFGCFDDEAVGLVVVVVTVLVRIMLADRVLFWLFVARLIVLYEAAE